VSKIVRYQFMGNWFLFTFLCVTGIGIPIALLYALSCTVRIETEMDNPEEVVYRYRAGKLPVKQNT
jgi:hypothetical protein